MIFKTQNNELAILGNTISDIKTKIEEFNKIRVEEGLFGQNGALSAFFGDKSSQPILDDKLLGDFEAFKDLFNQSSLSAEVLAEDLGGVDNAIVNYAKSCKNGELTTEGFKASIKGMSVSAKAATVAMQALSIAMNIGITLAVTVAIKLLTTAIENMADSLEDVENRIEDNKSALSDYTSKIEELKEKLEELNKLDVTYLNSAEKEKIETEKKYIESEIELLDKLAKAKENAINDDYIKATMGENEEVAIVKKWNQLTSGDFEGAWNSHQEQLKGKNALDILSPFVILDEFRKLDDGNYFSEAENLLNEYTKLQEEYSRLQRMAIKNGNNEDIAKKVEETSSEITQVSEELATYIEKISEARDSLIQSDKNNETNLYTDEINEMSEAISKYQTALDGINFESEYVGYDKLQRDLLGLRDIIKLLADESDDPTIFNGLIEGINYLIDCVDLIKNLSFKELYAKNFNLVVGGITEELNKLKAFFEDDKIFDTIKNSLKEVIPEETLERWEILKSNIENVVEKFKELTSFIGDKASEIELISALSDALKNIFDTISNFLDKYDWLFAEIKKAWEDAHNIEYSPKTSTDTKDDNDNDEEKTPPKKEENKNNTFLSAFNSADFAEQKEQLLELAKAGELTPETLESIEGYNTLLIETGFNSSKAVDKINKLIDATSRLSDMSSDLSSLGTAYKEFKEDGFVDISSIEALREKFGELKDLNGESLFEGFANVVGSADSSIDDKQQEFNKLATSYLLQEKALGKLTEANKDYYVTQLKSMGIANAESLVIQQLESDTQALLLKEEALSLTADGINKASTEKVKSFLKEASATNLCRVALFQLVAEEEIFNSSTLDPKSKIESLLELASAYGVTSKYLKDAQKSIDEYNASGGHSGYNPTEADVKHAQEELYNGVYADFFKEEYKVKFKVDLDSDKDKNKSSSSSNTVFDWIEIKLENIAKKTDKLKEKFENSFKLSSTNTNFKKYLNQISSEISANEKAISKYDAKLRSIGLDKKYVNKIKLGDYSIDDKLPEETQEKISEYQKWYDKKIACEEKIEEKVKERAEAENSYAEKRVKYYEDEISKIESLIDKREKLVGIKESIGLSASKSDYSYSVNKSSEEISRLKKQAEELKKLQKGVEEGSDAWNTYQEGIESNNEKILDLIESIADLAEKLAQLPLDKARKITENNANKSELYSLKSDNSNSYGSKNKYLDKQTQLAKSDAKAWSNALKNAQNNIKTLWYSGGVSSARKTSANKNKKEGELLSTAGLVVGSAAYNAVIKYNKAILAKQEAETESAKATENATKTLRENTKAKYDNMSNAYSIKRDVYSSQADRFQSKLDYIDAKNMKNDENLVKSTYNSILKASKNELSVLEDERKKYDLDKIRKQYENGELSLDDYRELVSYVNELDSSIYDAKTNLEELKDTIREETVFKPFVEMREDIEKTIDSVEKLISLINDDSLFNDDGSLTSLGSAKFSLLSQQLNKSKETIQSYQDQIKAATAKYQEFLNGVDNGYSEEEYQKDIQEFNSGLLDSLIESKSITDEIISIHTQQQQAIIDSIKEEINARSEALQKKKEYYDYDKQIRNKTKDIESLEAQKAALLATEDSLEKRRKLLELEEELNNKREELEETQKEHEINLVVNGLNDFSDDIQSQFDEYTKNLASSFEEQIKIIQNANLMYSQGYDSIFKTLNDVLGFYGSQFDASSFTPNLAPTTSTLTPTNMIDLSSMDGFINSNITPILTLPKLNIPDVENRANSSNIDINFGNLININGNANSETVDELKRMMPKITKQVTNSIVEDLKKNGFK